MPGWRLILFSTLSLLPMGLVGCGPALPKTYPASGSVVYQSGKPIKGGGSIQFLSADDPTLRIYGEIKPNGSFVLRTVKDNEQAPGAPQGEFAVTIQPRGDAAPIAATQKQKIQAGENQMKIEVPLPLPPPS
jgi:hypothetical protein